MRFKKLRILTILVITFLSLHLSACSTHDVYEYAKSYEATDEELKLMSEGRLDFKFSRGDFDSNLDYYKYLASEYLSGGMRLVDTYALPVCIISWAIGALIFFLARKSIGMRRMAVFTFIIGIPAIAFLISVGGAQLIDSFKG